MADVCFVVPEILHRELFSIPILSSILKAVGHNVTLMEFNKAKDVSSFFRGGAPEIVAYSLMSSDVKEYRNINNRLREHYDFFSVFGGAHTTFSPEFILEPNVDAVCVGEGDTTFSEFLSKFKTQDMYKVPNFCFKGEGTFVRNEVAPLVDDLDTLPFPDRKMLFDLSPFIAQLPIKTFFAGRGCPFHCTYCFNHAFNKMYQSKGKIMRLKSVDYLIEEIYQIKRQYPMEFIKFHDDVFGFNTPWLEEFAQKYPSKIGVPFAAYARPNMVNAHYVKLMRSAGCVTMVMAVECGNEQIRNEALKRKMSDKQIIDAANIIHEHGIKLYTLNMIGLPGEVEEDIRKTIRINRTIKADLADSTVFKLYSGLDITDYALKNGFALKDYEENMEMSEHSNLNFPLAFKKKLYIYNEFFALSAKSEFFENFLTIASALYPFRKFLRMLRGVYVSYIIKKEIYPVKLSFTIALKGMLRMFARKPNQI